MASKTAQLIIELKDKFTAPLKGMMDLYASLKIVTEGLNQTFGRLKDFLFDSLNAYAQQETAVNRLNIALKNQGFYTDEYSASLVALADDLRKTSTLSDDAIMETMGLLTTFGLAGKTLRETTVLAMDLAIGRSIDLTTATMLLGKAWAGETGTLSKMGFKLDETMGKAEKFAALQDQIRSKFGGSAAGELNTYAGKVKALGEEWSELKETIGKFLASDAAKTVTWMKSMVSTTNELLTGLEGLNKNSFFKVIERAGFSGAVAIVGLAEKVGLASTGTKQLLDLMLKVKTAAETPPAKKPLVEPDSNNAPDLEAERALGKARFDIRMAAIAEMGAHEKLSFEELQQTRVQQFVEAEEAVEAAIAAGFIKKEEAEKLHAQNVSKLQSRSIQETEAMNKARVASSMTMLSMLSGLSTAKTKEIAMIGKAAAFATTMINAHVAAGAALAAFAAVPPVAIAMASIMYAAGAAQASMIAGVPLAEGGMVMPRMGGIPAIIGEGGKSEVVLPLDDQRTKDKLRDSFGGGGDSVTINISAGTIVADNMSIKEFARKIDEQLFSLRTNRRSASFDD